MFIVTFNVDKKNKKTRQQQQQRITCPEVDESRADITKPGIDWREKSHAKTQKKKKNHFYVWLWHSINTAAGQESQAFQKKPKKKQSVVGCGTQDVANDVKNNHLVQTCKRGGGKNTNKREDDIKVPPLMRSKRRNKKQIYKLSVLSPRRPGISCSLGSSFDLAYPGSSSWTGRSGFAVV